MKALFLIKMCVIANEFLTIFSYFKKIRISNLNLFSTAYLNNRIYQCIGNKVIHWPRKKKPCENTFPAESFIKKGEFKKKKSGNTFPNDEFVKKGEILKKKKTNTLFLKNNSSENVNLEKNKWKYLFRWIIRQEMWTLKKINGIITGYIIQLDITWL